MKIGTIGAVKEARRIGTIKELEEGDEFIKWTEVDIGGARIYTSDDLPNPLAQK